ncbi:MASE1 domain-containing protein [Hyalangium sp.]|uniref:MASE1 domain-containing protein n=1 Tax=Hyalangium sp. TaxID=2028555 RepID=UPI002D5A9567|nr:MASE1 domain-containing protein [Hyalangium sp.]HYH97832.1 MASE1 domain-containing protein [Hyalangium sp.]
MQIDLMLRRWHPLVRLALFAALYSGLAWVAREISVPSMQVSPVWLPSGLVLFALLVTRTRHWPAVALTAISIGFFIHHEERSGWLTFMVSVCGALEGLLGAFLLRRFVGHRIDLHRVRDVIGLVTLAAGLSALLTSLLSVGVIVGLGSATWEQYWQMWEVFWIGDGLGVLVITPLLLTWLHGLKDWAPRRRWELGALVLVLILVAHAIFRSEFSEQWTFHPLIYLAFPFMLWAALRFEAHGTTLATLILSAVAIWHTEHDRGPFARPEPPAVASHAQPSGLESHLENPQGISQSIFLLQSFLGAISISGLLLAAALGERRRAQLKVSALNLELRQSLEMLARTQSELVARERMAALGELAATMAHEVRNPLGAIANCVSALRHVPGRRLETQDESLLEIIIEEVQRLDELVRGLLDFARPVQPQPRPEPLESVVEGALSAALRAQTSGAQVTVQREVAPDLPPALVDVQLLHVALSNLFNNALQAMPKGGDLNVRIEREESPGSPRLRLSISDSGQGMTPEIQKRIFEPFFTTRATGTGLGLPIVRRIVEGHSGEVEVSSTEGQGTTFTVRLPCADLPHSHLVAL